MSISNTSLSHACSPSTLPFPQLFGAQILDLHAAHVFNYSYQGYVNIDTVKTDFNNLNFCNITVTYTHPGQNDVITVTTWLPLEGWNGRFQGTGGGGWAASQGDVGLVPAIDFGYAASATDTGVNGTILTAEPWALYSPGNVNLPLLNDFASVALNDMAIIGKTLTKSFYGQPPAYSYWVGCSTGGRQGYMMAQRYPNAYDGIVAIAPAIYWSELLPSLYWNQQVMNDAVYHPPQCEFNAITAAAVEACDNQDGILDGVISNPLQCEFDPLSLVGSSFDCDGTERTITTAAAKIVQAVRTGPRRPDGSFLWHGLSPAASLSLLGNTTCAAGSNDNCTGTPWQPPVDWLRLFVVKDADFDLTSLTAGEFATLFHQSVQQYTSIIGTTDPDLSAFRDRGGKLLTWHGLDDQIIPVGGTEDYYNRVLELDGNARDYYRFFEAPGTTHCSVGAGPYPSRVLDAVVGWVEKGQAPEYLVAVNLTDTSNSTGAGSERKLCPYPSVQQYVGGDTNKLSSFTCVESG